MIITDLSQAQYSEDEIANARKDLLTERFTWERNTEDRRNLEAKKQAYKLKGNSNKALGQPVVTMPLIEYLRLCQQNGKETIHSEEWLKGYQKHFPDNAPNKL